MAAQPNPVPGINIKRIEVDPNDVANPDKQYLSKTQKDQALFSTKVSKRDAKVVFPRDHTPFTQAEFSVPADSEVPAFLRDNVELGNYDYHVNPMKGGGPGMDPTIIVN